jgi:hypothetical protein
VPGWETRGNPNFSPEGIMVHHTAGPRNGDAPSLRLCIEGRPTLPGPLCHIVLARSGKAHLVSGNGANHAGDGAQEVLDLVRKDEPVVGNAATRGYRDMPGLAGNAFFYGIEVENNGTGEPYPEAQLEALVKICAAVCEWHGWTPNRIVHHRQWTRRKADMSYRGNLPAMVAQMMDAGRMQLDASIEEPEQDDSRGTEGVEPCLPWDETAAATDGAATKEKV